jgi:RecJ-like exonuclease
MNTLPDIINSLQEWITSNIIAKYAENYLGLAADIITVATLVITFLTLVTVKKYRAAMLKKGVKSRLITELEKHVQQLEDNINNKAPISKQYFERIVEQVKDIKPYSTHIRFWFTTLQYYNSYKFICNLKHEDLNQEIFRDKISLLLGVLKNE